MTHNNCFKNTLNKVKKISKKWQTFKGCWWRWC